MSETRAQEIAVFGGGCFWCTEAVFSSLKGVSAVMSGYAGGHMKNPTYEDVTNGNTGHLECIRVTYDPAVISFDDLLSVFFNTHDPTTVNKQGNDIGEWYNSAIFYTTSEQKIKAENLIRELNETKAYEKPVVTSVRPLEAFYDAEDYHRDFYKNHADAPYCELVIAPKLEKLQKKFAQLVK